MAMSRPLTVRRSLLSMATALTLAAATWALVISHAAANGREIFEGARAVDARTPGHEDALPPDAARCANCHAGERAIGPRLTAASLTQVQPRRGGPPSHYDEATFCRALRDGIDPASVTLPRAMPRYAVADADCRSLWAFLTSE